MKKLLIGLVVFIAMGALTVFDPLKTLEFKITDLFFQGKPLTDRITVIAIDDKSIGQGSGLGRFKDWPRSYYSQLLRTLKPLAPRVVAFDLDFRERSRGMSEVRLQQLVEEYQKRLADGNTAGFDWYELVRRFQADDGSGKGHPDDLDFQNALNENGPVVLWSLLHFDMPLDERTKELPSAVDVLAPIFTTPGGSESFINSVYDRDGVVRRFFPWSSEGMAHFTTAIANAYSLKGASPDAIPVENPSAEEDRAARGVLIDYAARPGAYPVISFADVLAGRFDEALIKDKIILVGATAPILQDTHVTPTSSQPMAGVEIIANIVQQLLDMRIPREQSSVSFFILLALIAFGGTVVFLHLPLGWLALSTALLIIAYPIAASFLYQKGLMLRVIYPELAIVFTILAVLWYRNITEFRQKRAIKQAFAHYVSPIVVDELAKHPENLRLGGTRQQITVLFSDIVGFTTLSENLTPEDTVALLNDYLTSMTEIIFQYHGTLDKYQGDAIMALFGAPLGDEHHAVHACMAGLTMRKALMALHEKWHGIEGLPFKEELMNLDFRVGIASGPAVVGNVGSAKRFDYTAIGDIVNLGSRLESINRKYGTQVIVDKNTFTMITENHNPFAFRKLDTVRVKGKKVATEIFEVVGLADTIGSEVRTMLDDFENGRILYGQRNFIEAKERFRAALELVPDDGPSQIYLSRCDFYLRSPPERDWDAVVSLDQK